MIMRVGVPETPDIIVGIVLVIVVTEATRRTFGLILPVLALIFIAYTLVGSYIPGVFHVPYYSPVTILTKMALDFGKGMFGMILTVSVNYIFLFIVFGAFVQSVGAVKFFEQVGRLAGKRLRGGAALSAVASSSLVGMVTGTASANIVLTGSFTIPLMKKSGYSPDQAGAIEAAASTVGQVTPPVMGAAAFLMAYFTEVPYVKIMGYALLPALLTYVSMGIYCQLQAMKRGITPPTEQVDYKVMLQFSPLFLVPLAILIVLLVMGYSPMSAIIWAIIGLIMLSFLRKDTRMSWKGWAEAFTSGAVLGSGIAVMCAIIGIVVAIIITTGLAVKLPAAIETISGGNILIALVLTMFAAMLLGLGMPTTAAYTLVAFMVAPFLIRAGIPVVAAHFFVFYYAVFSIITPPVAPAAAPAAALAGGTYFKTGLEASKVAVAGFLLPFLIIWCPVLMLQPESLLTGALDLIAIIVMLTCFQIVLIGHYMVSCGWRDRLLAGVSILVLLVYSYGGNYLFLLGLGTFILLNLFQFRERARLRSADVVPKGVGISV